MLASLTVIALIVMYLLAQEALRQCHLVCMWALFGLLPLALTPYWIHTSELDLFLWIKIYSVMFCICWGSWLRFSSQGKNPWFLWTVALLLSANILEATIVDMLRVGWAHGLNAFSGALLIVTLPFGARHTQVDDATGYCDLRFKASLPWIIGYTTWNWTFVYLNYSSYSGHHTAVLLAALIVAIGDPQRWLQVRAATLGLNLLITATSYTGMLSVIDTTSWFDAKIAIAAALIVFGWMSVHVVHHLIENTYSNDRGSYGCLGPLSRAKRVEAKS